MRLLHTILRDRNIDGVRHASLATGTVVFSALNVFILNLLKPQGMWQLTVVFVGAVLSLTILVRAFQRLFLVSWARPVLGDWVYESSSGNWGLAIIGIHGGELDYTVQLYRDRTDAEAAARREPGAASKCFATVSSVGVTYHGGDLELVYKIHNTSGGYAPRSGMLVLSPLTPSSMKGYWRSDVGGEEANRGTLDLYRPETLGDGNAE